MAYSSADDVGKKLATTFALVLVIPIVSTLFGSLAGLIVGFFYNDTYALAASRLSWPLAAWQTGAMLAFCAGFVRGVVFTPTDKK
jgi:ABC-type dipeptide/oligopeptide/nickel transport system permease component